MKKKKKKKPSMHNTVTSSASLARRSLIIWHKIKQLSSMKSSKEKNNPLQCGLVLLHSTEREQQKVVQSMLCVTVHKLSWWLLAAFICLAQWVSRLLSGISTMHTHTCLSPSQPIRKSQKSKRGKRKQPHSGERRIFFIKNKNKLQFQFGPVTKQQRKNRCSEAVPPFLLSNCTAHPVTA